MPSDPYPVFRVQANWVLETEHLGSKRKFWYRRSDDEPAWLFKYPQPDTGQHWAEKVAAELAGKLGILHARVELAEFEGARGSVTESFARGGRELVHGNQLLAGKVFGYDPARRFRNADHTLDNIRQALRYTFRRDPGLRRATRGFAAYLVLDALIGNTDRHHENWGVIRRRAGDRWVGMIAPSFDHASSLGRELADAGSARTRRALLDDGRVGAYAERGRGGIYWDPAEAKAPSPLELVRRASAEEPEVFRRPLTRLDVLDKFCLSEVVARIPSGWMSPIARDFATAFLCYTLDELRKLRS